MIEDDQYPIHSPLEQSLTRNGKTITVEIYGGDDDGWILEVVDEHGNSTVWNNTFKTDQEALNEVLKTIDEDGIESLIGTPSALSSANSEPDVRSTMQMMAPLSDEELDELAAFLMSDAISDETMMLDTLDGFLTAIVSGPVTIMPGEWLPRVWGESERDEPAFKNHKQAERIIGLMMRHMNGIIWSLQHDPDTFDPMFDVASYPDDRDYTDAEMWAYGYMTGVELKRQYWQPFFDEPGNVDILRPIYLLGSDDVTDEERVLTETPEQRELLSEQIPASVAAIYRYWLPYRQAIAERTIATTYQRDHPKIGRNDPCPCGSGKKFKKCCGAPTVLH